MRAWTVSVTSTITVRVTVTVRSADVGLAGLTERVRVEARDVEERRVEVGAAMEGGGGEASGLESGAEGWPPLVTVLPSAETVIKVVWFTEHGLRMVFGLEADRPAPNLRRQSVTQASGVRTRRRSQPCSDRLDPRPRRCGNPSGPSHWR